MPSFDRTSGHLVVRVVYDGPAFAGKTENLRQLVRTFTPQRRGELYTPRPSEEGTAWFDWLTLHCGVVGGHSLRAQLLTTPGRSALMRRRWEIVDGADAIVFVCESTPAGLAQARRWLTLLRARLAGAGRTPPLIVQANKQDGEGALPPPEVARALGLGADTEILPASALSGSGVRETVMRAIRAAASLAEAEVLARGTAAMAEAKGEVELLAQLDGSAPMRSALGAELAPPFPDEDVARDLVWPRASGRRVLRRLGRNLAAHGITALKADAGSVVLRVGDLTLTGDLERRPEGRAAARAALEETARRHAGRSSPDPPASTLVVAMDADGRGLLWTIRPSTPGAGDEAAS